MFLLVMMSPLDLMPKEKATKTEIKKDYRKKQNKKTLLHSIGNN